MTPFTPVESQSPRSRFPRRNAITAFMLTKNAVLAASEPLNSSPLDEDNYSTLFGKFSCPTSLVTDGNLNRCNLSLKRPLEKNNVESRYDGNCNERDLRLTLADAFVESHLECVSQPKPKKCRVSQRAPYGFPCSFPLEKEN